MTKRQSTKAFLALGSGLAAVAAWWVYRDYRAWLKLGSGGLPGTFQGWLQTTIWRLQKNDPLNVHGLERLAASAEGNISTLSQLPRRATARPRVGPHPVPHRQLNQRAPAPLIAALQAEFDKAVAEHGSTVTYALSHFERHTMAVTSRLPSEQDPVSGSSHGEIAHIHEVDGSMHMILSPGDSIAAIRGGWAEMHGLAGVVLGLPATYLLVYAPQTDADVAAAAMLLKAAITYMTRGA